MNARHHSICAAALVSGLAVPAQAVVGDYTYHGTVGSILDSSGVFGTAAAGDPFTLVFRVDTDRGSFGVGGGGSGGSGSTYGGTRYIGSQQVDFAPRVVLSPVSAVLTIDGHSLNFAGVYDGSEQTGYALTADQYGGPLFTSGSDEYAVDQLQQGGLTISDRIEAEFTALRALHLPLVSSDTPYAVTFDKDFTSRTSFTYSRQDTSTGQTMVTSGALNATDFSITPSAAVPEPASWALLLTGFALTGAALRSRRKLRA